MSRPKLSLARRAAPADPARPALSLVKKALRLYKGRDVPKAVYRANALKWLAAMQSIGLKHVLRGYGVGWGRPGQPNVDQVFAPRRLRAGGLQ